jgi:transcriptional regulator with XRE-family HTH domain
VTDIPDIPEQAAAQTPGQAAGSDAPGQAGASDAPRQKRADGAGGHGAAGSARGHGAASDTWNAQMEALGAFIRSQRKLANLSLRQLAELTTLSNPYLSQIERGLHQPSVRVLKLLSGALNVSAETLLAQAGLLDAAADGDLAAAADEPPPSSVEAAIVADERLADEQKAALLAVYHSMLRS